MQASDTGELPERSRYYQGMLDIDDLNSGQEYFELKDSYVIFICKPDIFGKGLAKYTFENLCLENPEIKLNDRAYKYFFIATNYDKMLNEEQRSFLKLVTSNKSTGKFANKISKLVEDAKHNTQWRKQFMEWERQMAYKFREGVQEGKQEKAQETAAKLLKMNLLTKEQISQATGLSLPEIQKLAERK